MPAQPSATLNATRKVQGYECVWEDGTRIVYASRSCAEDRSACAEVPAEQILRYRWVQPEALHVECPQCGLPWGECDEGAV